MRPFHAAAALLILSACNPCYQLAVRLCSCQPDDYTQQACQQRANDELSRVTLTNAQSDRCTAITTSCGKVLEAVPEDCPKLATDEGKLACGLAFDNAPDAGIR